MYREFKLAETVKKEVARFIATHANPYPLITITNVKYVRRSGRVQIFITVFPQEKEKAALNYLYRKEKEMKSCLQKRIKAGHLPDLKFEIDEGEKNRQRIEEISAKI
jgi:ribosome-binding factor A